MSVILSAEDHACMKIRQWILSGDLAPGSRLVHRRLATELGMSSAPLVLALRVLENDGLVVNIPGFGAYVRTWSAKEIVDLYRIRGVQEGLACAMCAERARQTDLNIISSALDAYEHAQRDDIELITEADMAFHNAIVQSAQCKDLERTIESLAIIRYCISTFYKSFHVSRPIGELSHRPILEAIINRDADSAEMAGRKHIQDSLEINRYWIEKVDDIFPKKLSGTKWNVSRIQSERDDARESQEVKV